MIFDLVDPPDGQAATVRRVIDGCTYPWWRLLNDAPITVRWGPVGTNTMGTYDRASRTITIASTVYGQLGAPFTFAHELGHAVDSLTFETKDRDRLRVLLGTDNVWRHPIRDGYADRPSEAWADLFVRIFCPDQWAGRLPRFSCWTDDVDAVRDAALARSIRVFTDVDPDSTHADAIHELAAQGIIGGYADGTFRPDEPVTRGQLATILSRFAAR